MAEQVAAAVVSEVIGKGGSGGGSRTDSGWVKSTTIQASMATAVAGINVAAAIAIAKQQYDIAKRNIKIAEEIQAMMTKYYYPCEIKTLKEACDAEINIPQYEEQAGRFATTVSIQFAKARDAINKQFNTYCCASNVTALADLAVAEAKATADAVNYGYRYAEARADALNDVRWARKTQMLQLGRGLGSQAVTYSAAARGAFSSLGSQASASAGGALERLGYLSRREPYKKVPQYTPQAQHQQYKQYGTQQPMFDVGGNISKFTDNAQVSGIGGGNGLINLNNDQGLLKWDFGAGVSGNDAGEMKK